MTSSSPSIGDAIYNSAVQVGVARATGTLITGVIMGVILICVGGYFMFSKETRTQQTQAVVTDVNCIDNNCTVKINYNVNNTSYNSSITTGDALQKDSVIVIKYNPDNPQDMSYNESSPMFVGLFSSIFALITILLVYLNYYFKTKYTHLAAMDTLGMGSRSGKSMLRLM
jgi:hypothetical protein